MSSRREEKALLEFKHILEDVVHLLRKSSEAETVCFYWVNRMRSQFVLETSCTILPNAIFQDRTSFGNHFLDPYKDIKTPVQLEVGRDIEEEQVTHYHNFVPVKHMTLIPFINKNETVAITVLDTKGKFSLGGNKEIISAYSSALINVLNTYLELSDLYEKQNEWPDYETALNRLAPNLHKVEILYRMAEEMQKILPGGGISIAARGMECWVNVLRSSRAPEVPALGLMVEERSMAYEALEKGDSVFSIHFNQNPKRISTSETNTEGATLAIPLMIADRRHAVILAYDSNPLVFKESAIHQLKNLVRIAGLAIQVNSGKMAVQEDLLATEYGSLIPDLWERSLQNQIARAGKSGLTTWFGFITIDNLPEIRSRLRLEDLKRLQRALVKTLNPSRTGFNGFIGFNTDYIYSYLLICDKEETHEKWKQTTKRLFKTPVELSSGESVGVVIKIGSVPIVSPQEEVHDVVRKAKYKLSEVMKESASTGTGI